MKPQYSILFCNQLLSVYDQRISEWLYLGIKVIWFGTREDVEHLRNCRKIRK